jgi:Zn-dependent protease
VLLNLLPLWPLDGGRVAVDLGEGLLGTRGKIAALILSVLTAGLLAVWVMLELSVRLEYRFDPRYALYLEQFGVLLMYCFLLWLRSFKELWPEQQVVPSS